MKRTKMILSHLVVFCLGGCLVNAVFGCLLYAEAAGLSEVFIDFEHLPDGTATGLGPIGEDYAEWGIHFRTLGVDPSKSPLYSRFLHDSTYANCGAGSPSYGFNIVVDLDIPVYGISTYVTSAAGTTVTMTARDAHSEIVGSVVSPPIPDAYTFVGPVELIPGQAFTSVEWRSSSVNAGVGVDDLRIVMDDALPADGEQGEDSGHLVAYWNFNEGQGEVAHDVSGHDHHGTLNGPVGWTTGYEGTGLTFAGIDNYVRVEDSPGLNPTKALTLAAWISPVWYFNNRILQKEPGDNQYRLLKERGENMVFDLAGVTNGRLEYDRLPPDGEWAHVAATYDGAAMKLYYNAELVHSHPATGALRTSSEPLIIGSKCPGAPAGDEYRGLMDELRIYDRALTEGEVKALVAWTPTRGIQITDVKMMRGGFRAGAFRTIEEVDRIRVGDFFQIVVTVTNLGSTTETVANLYDWDLSGPGHAEHTGQPCMGLYLIDVDPGESVTLYPFCPASQAFEAETAGHVDMNIVVSEDCRTTFGFDIEPPSDEQLEITGVKIVRGEFVGGAFRELEEVDEIAVDDVFQVSVEVTNTGDATATVGNLYRYVLSGQGGAEVVGQLCLGLYLIDLEPGESAWLDAFCPGTQAFQATAAGGVTMDVTVEDDVHHTVTFQIFPRAPEGLTVTGATIISLWNAGGLLFEEMGEIQSPAVGDLFTIKVKVTNQGDGPVGISNIYDWSLSGTGDAAVLGGQPCVCLAWEELQSGDSAILIPFCGCHAFEATQAGPVTMHISVEPDCHGTFTFQIGP